MGEKYGWRWWLGGTAKEGIAHVLLSLAIAAVLWPVYDISMAALGNMAWFARREFRDAEVELAKLSRDFRPLVNIVLTACAGWLLFTVESPERATVALCCWLVSVDMRNLEIRSLPYIWRGLGFKSEPPLRPARAWSLEQLRHGISGVVPVWFVWMPVYLIFR